MSRTRDPDGMTQKELDIGESDLALDPEGLLDEDLENPSASEKRRIEDVERDALQRPDPAEDALPDRAFDRIVPGV